MCSHFPPHLYIRTNAMLPAGLYHIVCSETSIPDRISILLCLFICLFTGSATILCKDGCVLLLLLLCFNRDRWLLPKIFILEH